MSPARLRISFAAAEAYPYAKVGGLADVACALPRALARRGHDVTLLLPAYPGVAEGAAVVSTLAIPVGAAVEPVDVLDLGRRFGVSVHALAHERAFGRADVYGYPDDDARFALFAKAAVAHAAASAPPDVLHANDWHLGLAPQYAREGPFASRLAGTAVVLTIHNLAYQGRHATLTPEALGVTFAPPRLGRFADRLLARGIASADAVSTVSHRYREEILSPEHGEGLDSLLRTRRSVLRGILNGLDYREFDPLRDPHVPAPYDAASLSRRAANKAALQRATGLEPDPQRPLAGMVSRLVDQKGVDLVCEALDAIAAMGAQTVIMGLGDRRYRMALRRAAARRPDRIAYVPTDDEAAARRIYAGADLFLAPSRWEPCGLGPLIALRYGAVPVVRATGGLAETILDVTRHPQRGLGFTFRERTAEALLRAVATALRAYEDTAAWQELQRRGMAAEFSWDRAAIEYERLYRGALRRAPARAPRPERPGRRPKRDAGVGPAPIPVALVHHANQLVITDGYDNRDGITTILAGYERLLSAHERLRIPVGVHFSGTLLEAIAWYRPRFLDRVRALRERGIVWLPGGTYAENVMPLFDPAFNREQLAEKLRLYEDLLECPPSAVRVCWVPERVWDTRRLARVLADPGLPNGGYRSVLLDDRLLFGVNGRYPGSPRSAFDDECPYDRAGGAVRPEACRPYRIAGGHGLAVTPISAHLRYWIPPRRPEDLRLLEGAVRALAGEADDRTIVCYADDLEKAAGVAGWRHPASRYARLLRWLTDHPELARPVALDAWLDAHPPVEERPVEPGTFFELAQGWGAGEDYRGWADCEAWAPARAAFARARRAVSAVRDDGADEQLAALAGKHLLASAHETAWQDAAPRGGRAPAPWARAVASHARACLPLAAAAGALGHGAGPATEVLDVDADGEDEVVLRGDELYVVVSPAHGGRIVLLCHRTPDGGALSIGNPTDHWNFQEELNRYMDLPANHPGALADVGYEHERWRVDTVDDTTVRMVAEDGLQGSTKTLALLPAEPVVGVRYELALDTDGFATEACLSPDYLSLLRGGRRGVATVRGAAWRGARNGSAVVWLAHTAAEPVRFAPPAYREVGHGLNVRVEAQRPLAATTGTRRNRWTFDLVIGSGPTDARRCRRLLESARQALDR